MGSGADGITLQATYKQADTTAFQDSVGHSVVEVCKVVPDGVLMFLPSYSMLDRLMTRWKVGDVAKQGLMSSSGTKTEWNGVEWLHLPSGHTQRINCSLPIFLLLFLSSTLF